MSIEFFRTMGDKPLPEPFFLFWREYKEGFGYHYQGSLLFPAAAAAQAIKELHDMGLL